MKKLALFSSEKAPSKKSTGDLGQKMLRVYHNIIISLYRCGLKGIMEYWLKNISIQPRFYLTQLFV